ncbi:MAG: hydrogenase maturation nickel metallochaperone HypA [Myxococcota bacterium]
MHELSLTRSVVAIVREKAAGRKVKGIRLSVGQLAGVELDALRFCFPLVTEGTDMEGVALHIDEIPGRAKCLGCNDEIALEVPLGLCPCEKRKPLRLLSGDELSVKEMEVE